VIQILQEPSIRDLIIVHTIFAIVCVFILILPFAIIMGIRNLVIVVFYNLLLPLFGHYRGHEEWIDIWLFVFPLSILQVIPDWFLSAQLGALVFPVDGSSMIGDVPVYMAGLWVIPLFVIVFTGVLLKENQPDWIVILGVSVSSLIIFGVAEENMWRLSWYAAADVAKFGHIALYIVIPELALGASAYIAYDMVKERNILWKLFWAYIVMIMYIGNASFFYFLIETVFGL
jgi:hypothetical protein